MAAEPEAALSERRSEPHACCDGCGQRAWCRLTSWREDFLGQIVTSGGHVVGKFLCETCATAIPDELKGWR